MATLLEFVKSEEFTKMVIDTMMKDAIILPSGIAIMAQADRHHEYWNRGTYANEPEQKLTEQNFRRAYLGTYYGSCTPSRNPITETWTPRHRCVDARYHPEDEPIQVDADNVFSPRPAWAPVEDF